MEISWSLLLPFNIEGIYLEDPLRFHMEYSMNTLKPKKEDSCPSLSKDPLEPRKRKTS